MLDLTGRADGRRFNIIDVVMVSAMGPPGGGRTFITERSLDASLTAWSVRMGERSSDLLRTKAALQHALGPDSFLAYSLTTKSRIEDGIL